MPGAPPRLKHRTALLLAAIACALPAAVAANGPMAPAVQPAISPFALSGPMQQGGLVHGRVPQATAQLLLDGAPVPVSADGQFIVAFDRDAPPTATLTAQRADGSRIEQQLAVRPGNWRIEHVDAPPLGSAATTEEFKARRAVELEQIDAARKLVTGAQGWRQDFIWPIKARISGRFGSQRIYRGNPGSYHSGLDLAGGAGTAFVAPADGVVILAASEPFTLEGHLLLIDHGMGLTSAFLHCSRLDVQEGDAVHRGQMLGAIGATGRASGPHLHWGLRWNMARIDPLLLLGAAR